MFRLATRSRALFSPLAIRHASTAAAAPGAPAAEPQTSSAFSSGLEARRMLADRFRLCSAGAEKMMRRFWKSVSIEKTPEGALVGLFEKE